jgi:hypothetical protein
MKCLGCGGYRVVVCEDCGGDGCPACKKGETPCPVCRKAAFTGTKRRARRAKEKRA